MNRILDVASICVGVLAAVVIAAGAARSGRGFKAPEGGAKVSASVVYHSGKEAATPVKDAVCQKEGCHVRFAHGKGIKQAAYVNLHMEFVECLACHGQEAEARWSPGAARGKRKTLRYDFNLGTVEPHKVQRKPMQCRGCHSPAGASRLAARGVAAGPGFENPFVLRMLEEEPRRWSADAAR